MIGARGSVLVGLGLVGVVGSLVAATMIGAVFIPLPAVWDSLCSGLLGWPSDRTSHASVSQAAIVWHLRLPRVVLAILVGGGLALAGAVLQGLFRNPMADSGIIGVSSGGALGAVSVLTFGGAMQSPWLLPAAAFIGAASATSLIYGLATRQGRTSLVAFLLAGMVMSALLGAITSFIMTLVQNTFELREILFWLLGGLEGRGWKHVGMVVGPVLLGSLALSFFARELNILAVAGEEGARSVGVDHACLKTWTLGLTALVTGVLVSVSGIIGFVGLIVPHLMRFAVGPDHRILLPVSFLGGALLLVWADVAARTLFAPQELQLGILTAVLGAPFFLLLLQRQLRRSEGM
ncbi:MAG: iron ABC transporter permease [Candidatus Manganitrophaceae bacterium]